MPVPSDARVTRGAKRKADWKAQPYLLRAPQCHRPSCPTGSAGTAGTTRVVKRSRSSSAWPRARPGGAEALDRILGVRFRDASLRQLALTHRSYAFENELPANNERLEFLGDAVLGIVVTDMAFGEFPEMPEGELAKLRAAIVNMSALADAARDLGLGRFVLLGRGEEMSGSRDKSSILADALEAVLGAVYLDRGLPAARKLIERVFGPPDDRVRPW